MILDNVIYFGYGDIAISCNLNGCVTFQGVRPSGIIGEEVDYNKVECITELIKINVNDFDLESFNKIATGENLSCKAGEYILDFSNYNLKSWVMVNNARNYALYHNTKY